MVKTWNEALRKYTNSNSAMADWLFAWEIDSTSNLAQFLMSMKKNQAMLLTQAQLGIGGRCTISALLSYSDYGSDILLAVLFFSSGRLLEGYLTIALPSLVLVVHAYFAYLFKERPIVILASLLGLKPFIDVYRVVNGVSHRGQFTPVFTMSLGRGIELSAESIPQIFLQTILVIAASVAGRDVSVMQYVTIAISIATSGFIAANIDYDMDCSEKYRREMPEICGWIPEAKSDRLKLVFLETFFLGSYTGMRVLSCAALGYIMPAALISWISLEFLAFTVAKVYFNTYWYVRPAPKGI